MRQSASANAAAPTGLFDESQWTEEQKAMVTAIRTDMENAYTDGFVQTPLSPDVQYVTPYGSLSGGQMTKTWLGAELGLARLFADLQSVTPDVTSIQVVSPDFNAFEKIAHPPRQNQQPPDAAYAVYLTWETSFVGRSPLLDKTKPFYMSGRSMFYVNEMGQVSRGEVGGDQSALSILLYFEPGANMLSRMGVLPKDLIATKPEEDKTKEA